MGAGATSGEEKAQTNVSASTSSSSVDSAISWLLASVDKERADKEWLAKQFEWLKARYDEKCTECQVLKDDLAAARLEVQAALVFPAQAKRSVGDFMRHTTPAASAADPQREAAGSGMDAVRAISNANTDLGRAPAKEPADVGRAPAKESADAGRAPAKELVEGRAPAKEPAEARRAAAKEPTVPGSPHQQTQSSNGGSPRSPTTPTRGGGALKERRGLNLGGLQVDSRQAKQGQVLSPQNVATSPDSGGPPKSSNGEEVDKPEKAEVEREGWLSEVRAWDAQTSSKAENGPDRLPNVESPTSDANKADKPKTGSVEDKADKCISPKNGSEKTIVVECSSSKARELMEMRSEPQSALLKRREDWSIPKAVNQEVTSDEAKAVAKALNVVSSKIVSMSQEDPECPCSPKRPVKRNRMANAGKFATCIGIMEPIVENKT